MSQKVRYFIFVLWLLYGQFNATAQVTTDTVTLSGRITVISGTLPAGYVKLASYVAGSQGAGTYPGADGSFKFKLPVREPVVYQLQYGGFVKDILFTGQEHEIDFEIFVNNSRPDQMVIKNSRENQAHEIFVAGDRLLHDTLKNFKPNCLADAAGCEKNWAPVLTGHNASLQMLEQVFAETFTAKVLAPMAKTPVVNSLQPPVDMMDRHFFDSADLSIPLLYTTPDMGSKFATYLDDIADTSAQARLNFMQGLFLKAGNTEARKRLAVMLFNVLTSLNREAYLQTMCHWAPTQLWFDTALPSLSAHLKMLAKVLPGNKTPNVTGPDLEGNIKSLSKVAAGNKLTLLIIWESDCQHCQQAMPEFKRLYEKYKGTGFNVFAASLDHDPAQWKKFVADNQLTWVNINAPDTATAIADYVVQRTPAMALIDKNGIIIHRFIELQDLDKYIAAELKK
jgi:peroxiredoxin